MMKAVVFTGKGVRIEQRPKPSPSADEVVIRVLWASICATDIRIARGETNVKASRILGHDFSGIVEQAGTAAPEALIGQKVVADPAGSCGACNYCRSGQYHLCPNGEWMGFERDGGLAQYVRVPARNVVVVPSGVSLDQAAVLEPYVVALHALDFAEVSPGDCIAVVGCGPIGLAQISVAKLVNLQVAALDPRPERRRMAKKVGADAVLNPVAQESEDQLLGLTGGLGFRCTVEASGTQQGVDLCGRITRAGGSLLLVGSGKRLRGPVLDIEKELRMQAVELGPFKYPRVLELIAHGSLAPKELISKKVPLSAAPSMFNALSRAQPNLLRVLVDCRSVDASFPLNA